MSENPSFRPATPQRWVLWPVQTYLSLDLAWRNRLRLERRDLEVLRDLPRGAGTILASNHADETDFKACLELSRRCNRRFLYMMNREAFDEGRGIAGWWLQRLGAFSVERGGRNDQAKRSAIEVVKRGQEVLVVFPEGEIYYLNDLVQPLKSGVVEIGMQAVVEARRIQPDWTAYLVPMALKYHYRRPIGPILERRTRLLEQRLFQRISGGSLPRRLVLIVAELLSRQEMIHRLKPDPDRLAEMSERVQEVRQAVLAQMDVQYPGPTVHSRAGTMDRTWRLSSFLRNLLRQGKKYSDQSRRDSATTWQRSSGSPRWGVGSRTTSTWTRLRSGSRRWFSSWSVRSTVPSGHTNWPIGTFSFASAIPSIWGASSRATFRIRGRSAAGSLNNSGA